MSNKLPIPSDLQHLIEKRDGEERRRAADETVTESEQHTTGERRETDRREEDRNA